MEESTQLNELRDLLRRAERTPVKTAGVRRDALNKLIELSHSPYSSTKLTVADKITLFIKDFPELEDDAINAVYDLCEDPDPNVRIRGYRTISGVSKVQPKWVKRNADVLVQLLQSDDTNEVDVVKRALTEHLDLDPATTLGVLCDQLIPLEDPVDEEDQIIRERLRSLVLTYLSEDAKRAIIERHASTRNTAEEVLVSGLLKAISKLGSLDVEIIVKHILLSLPTFGRHSSRGRELLDVVLSQARATLKEDVLAGNLSHTRYYLELTNFLSVEKQVVHPAYLLRFLQANLVPKLSANRLSEDDTQLVFRLYGSLVPVAFGGDIAPGADVLSADELAVLRRHVAEACAILLPIFLNSRQQQDHWDACRALVKTCVWRKSDKPWVIPSNLISNFEKVQQEAANAIKQGADRKSLEEIQSDIRSLLPPPAEAKPSPRQKQEPTLSTSGGANISKGTATIGKANGAAPVIIKRNRDLPASLPPRPPVSLPPTPSAAPLRQRGDRPQRQDRGLAARSQVQSTVSGATIVNPITVRTTSPPSKGKQKGGEGGISLLNRLDTNNGAGRPTTPSIPAKRRAEPEEAPRKRPATPQKLQDSDMPATGWSIKGAASKQLDHSARGRNGSFSMNRPSSLLARLNSDGSYVDSGERRGKKKVKSS